MDNYEPDSKPPAKNYTHWIWLALALIYDFIPLDFIPDIPVIGWIDDALVTTAAIMNILQHISDNKGNETISSIYKWLKWIFISLAVIIILLLLLFGSIIIKLFQS